MNAAILLITDDSAVALGPCIGCKRPFVYNPVAVPSTSEITGERAPLCKECFDKINAARVARGDAPFEIRPDAYEPCSREAVT